jgi:hypothetical protein
MAAEALRWRNRLLEKVKVQQAELETRELLLDEEAFRNFNQSITQGTGKRGRDTNS